MKILKEKYPKGTIKRQRTDGRYMDGILYENIKLVAKNMVKDMTIMGIASSSTLEVGTGKSTLFQQIAEAYTYLMNEYHGLELTFTAKNIVFRPEDLITRAFEVPKYSCIILDEWDDNHYWSALGMSLRQFFRKCRQLNLFILAIIPNFFQMPMGYAVSRSLFFIDVKFGGEFDRGYFDFYSFNKKKELYIKGKKTHNYKVVRPDFYGRFLDGYGIPEKEYRKAKYEDMLKYDEEHKEITPKDIKMKIFDRLQKAQPKLTLVELGNLFGVDSTTISRWRAELQGKIRKDRPPKGAMD